jgi:large-conductance mechanosensitive channel
MKSGKSLVDSILHFLIGIALILAFLFGCNLIWNFVAPVWRLPELNYGQFLGTVFLFMLTCFGISSYFKPIINIDSGASKKYLDTEQFLKDLNNEGH